MGIPQHSMILSLLVMVRCPVLELSALDAVFEISFVQRIPGLFITPLNMITLMEVPSDKHTVHQEAGHSPLVLTHRVQTALQ